MLMEIHKKIVGTTFDEVAIKPLDFYSIGHIIFGYITYGIATAIFLFNAPLVALFLSLLTAISWELIENSICVDVVEIKFECRKDSAVNSQSDVLITLIGALLSYGCSCTHWMVYLFLSFLIIGVLAFLMEVCFKLTYNNSKEISNE